MERKPSRKYLTVFYYYAIIIKAISCKSAGNGQRRELCILIKYSVYFIYTV